MSDIVERLRKVDFETRPFWSSNTIRDAIAEIATLSAKLAEAERERDAVREQHKDFVVAVLGQSREECLAAGPRDEHDDFLAHIKKLREQAAHVVELEKALEPFAETYERCRPDSDAVMRGEALDLDATPDDALVMIIPTLGDLRHARAALAATKKPKPSGNDLVKDIVAIDIRTGKPAEPRDDAHCPCGRLWPQCTCK